ncbi:MAG: RIP metalloprotease RseP [Omnitrophica WOR_2 bacterium GWA2_47_8]|nr:MAG: RIP metalloprotease RseP [Omnitrophica WOR_2 bacterium GWA2_47_8]
MVFLAVLSVLIVVHEWGHFITAKKLGVRVERFSLGFGPKLFSKIIDGTEFLLCLIPLGGYVKMAGDERLECKGQPEEFYSKPPGHRALIVLNGPLVNFILAYVALTFVFVLGYPDLSSNIGEVMKDYPAETAGLMAGDQIIRIEHRPIENWTDVQKTIAVSREPQLDVDILRDGQPLNLTIIPKVEKIKNIFGQMQQTRMVGIRPAKDIIVHKYPFFVSVKKAGEKLYEITTMTYQAIFHMLTGSMSAKENMTGPIGIFYIIKTAADMGFSHLLYILGVISASLAIFNLLPVIPLDGGHLFLLGVERIRGKALSEKVDLAIAKIGFSLIICLALFVFYSDFVRFGWIDAIMKLLPGK